MSMVWTNAGMRCWPNGSMMARGTLAYMCGATSAARSAGWRLPLCATTSSNARCLWCALSSGVGGCPSCRCKTWLLLGLSYCSMLDVPKYGCSLQVLDTIIHADRLLFIQMPSLAEAAVYVHLSSHMEVGPAPFALHQSNVMTKHPGLRCTESQRTEGCTCVDTQELNMTVRWGVLSQRSGWPLSPVTLLDAWWRRSNAGADDLGTAAAATLPIAQLQQGLMTRTDQERAQELLLDDQVASSNLSRGASEVNVPQQSGLILPAAAQPLAEELQQAGEQPSGLILPVAAQPLAADGCAQLDDDRGIVITPRRDLGQESCTAVVSSSRHIACPQSTPLAQDGDGYTPDVTMRAESGAVSAESSAASMQASVLECSMQDDVLTRPFTVRDIVREWYESGREAVNLRL